MKRIAAAFGVGCALSLSLVLMTINSTEVPPASLKIHGYVYHFAPPSNGFEVLLLQGDGQAYASIAQDPMLQRPDLFGEGRVQEAFFAQRPLYSYLAWALSAGRPRFLQAAFVALTAIAGGLLVAATVAVLAARGQGQNLLWAPVILLLPNVLFAERAFTPDILATALSFAGLALWSSARPRRGFAVALFVLAVLARESALIVAVVLVAYEIWHRRFRVSQLTAVAVPGAAYLAWMIFVRHNLQSGPETIARNSSFAVPLVGVAAGASRWTSTDAVVVGLLIGLMVIVAARTIRRVEAWIIVAYLASSVVLNDAIWQSWVDIGRVFVPGSVLGLTLVVPVADANRKGLPISSP